MWGNCLAVQVVSGGSPRFQGFALVDHLKALVSTVQEADWEVIDVLPHPSSQNHALGGLALGMAPNDLDPQILL
jgi:hypothetical protein